MSYGDESSPSSSPSLRTTRPPRLRTRTKTVSSVAVPSVTEVGLGMLHAAAALGDAEAALALAHRYEKGLGVEASPDVAAFYYLGAAGESHSQFHRSGRQPSWEMNRLRDGEEEAEVAGQTGDEDERLRKLVAQAEEDGLVPSMVQLAGLLYWGHRGFARDQPRARGLWDAVAERGFLAAAGGGDGGDPFPFETTNAEVAAAGMFLKGEGGDANHTRAVELYERAAAKGNVAALNGLGYAYFFGNHLPQDLPRAFGYFREASASEAAEGDSLFNAAHCLANGLGTERDEGAAVALYDAAAVRFGHFDSIHEMATRHMLGRVPRPSPSSSPNPNASGGDGHPLYQPRNVNQALRYLSPVARGGDWGGRVRSGFDAFLDVGKARRKLGVSGLHMLPSAISSPSSSDSSFSSSSSSSSSSSFSSALSSSGQVNSARPLLLYAEAAQMGFEIAQSNAAYLLDKRVVSPHDARALLLLEPPPHPPRLSPLPSLPPPKQAQGYIAAGQGDDAAAPLAEDFDALPSGGGSPAASSVASSGAPPQSVSSSSSLSSSFLSSSSSSSSSSFADDAGAVSKLWSLHFHAAAAAQENHESFVAIGDAHFYGYGVDLARGGGGGSRRQIQQQEQKPDYEGALWWYSKAAQAGVPRGAYNLGYMYERGLGAPASEVRAERHYRRAAELLAARAAERRERNRRGGSFGLDGGGHGYGESILGDELHAKAVLWVSLAGLRLRRTAREWGFEWAASSFLDY
jgi:TPR repeat protein